MNYELKNIGLRHLRCNSGEIEGLPSNPRKISKKQKEKLKKSLMDAPEMLNLRELLVVPNGDGYIVIAGNMRLEAAKTIGMETIPCKILPADTPAEKLREYTIKDNVAFGEDDWELLKDWDAAELEGWGVCMPQNYNNDDDDISEIKEKHLDDWFINIECQNEQQCQQLYNELIEKGIVCKIIH